MPQAKTIDTEQPSFTPTLTTRSADLRDADVFLWLARLCVEERGSTFDENNALFCFAGIPRCDPAILLLFDGDAAIGFSFIALRKLPLTSDRVACEELVFVAGEHRSLDAEMALHEAAHAIFDEWAPEVREMLIPRSPHATEAAGRMAGGGYQPAQVTTRRVCEPVAPRDDRTLN